MTHVSDDLLNQLLVLIDQLRADTADFLDRPGDQQAWYNRGYANGMVVALTAIAGADRIGGRLPDNTAEVGTQVAMAWEKAYRHGEQMGQRETHEITGNTTA